MTGCYILTEQMCTYVKDDPEMIITAFLCVETKKKKNLKNNRSDAVMLTPQKSFMLPT